MESQSDLGCLNEVIIPGYQNREGILRYVLEQIKARMNSRGLSSSNLGEMITSNFSEPGTASEETVNAVLEGRLIPTTDFVCSAIEYLDLAHTAYPLNESLTEETYRRVYAQVWNNPTPKNLAEVKYLLKARILIAMGEILVYPTSPKAPTNVHLN